MARVSAALVAAWWLAGAAAAAQPPAPAAVQGPATAEPILLAVGSQRLLDTPDIERVAVGAPELVGVRVVEGGRRLLLTGLAPGVTTLTLWDRRGGPTSLAVQVAARDPEAVRREVAALLEGIEGVTLRVAGEFVVLDGLLHRASDRTRVARLAALYPQVRDLTRPSPLLQHATAARINEQLAAAGYAGLRVRVVGDRLVLEGSAPSEAALEHAARLAAAYTDGVASAARAGLPEAPLVALDVRFVELSRQALAAVGLRWPDSVPVAATLSAAAETGRALAPQLTLSASLAPVLQALVREGQARLLANPRLVTRSGDPADFLAGGEIPIALVGERQSSLVWRPYGIQVEVTPQADRTGRIAAALRIEVSTLDRANGVPEAPALATRRVRTAITVRTGQTIALSGLLSADAAKDVQRVPGIGRIPVLGELFKSRAWQARETELVVLVTPALLPEEAAAADGAATQRRADERYRQAGDRLVPRLDD
ncbi:MAG TPA: pilus assembly protein N-terminal domain-containing protein [Thermodesulfobacteriota bacterium]|nr:pilus assembly protein N-terminal domain-containing protein [Thermodesulfobacteriota bacterium]